MVGKKEVEKEERKEAKKFSGTEHVPERKAFPL
jgi:hypothetical protein